MQNINWYISDEQRAFLHEEDQFITLSFCHRINRAEEILASIQSARLFLRKYLDGELSNVHRHTRYGFRILCVKIAFALEEFFTDTYYPRIDFVTFKKENLNFKQALYLTRRLSVKQKGLRKFEKDRHAFQQQGDMFFELLRSIELEVRELIIATSIFIRESDRYHVDLFL